MILQFLTVHAFRKTSFDLKNINTQGHPQKTLTENIQCRYAMCLAVVSGVFILLPTVSSQIPPEQLSSSKIKVNLAIIFI